VAGHVTGWQDHLAGTVDPLYGHAPIVAGACDGPVVPVLDPLGAGEQLPVVLPGHDQVADSCRLVVGDIDPLVCDDPGPDPVSSGSSVEFRNRGGIAGDHQAGEPGVDVSSPRLVDGVEQLLPASRADPALSLVGIYGCPVPEAELDAGLLLPCAAEPADIGELWDDVAPVPGQQGERTASFDAR